MGRHLDSLLAARVWGYESQLAGSVKRGLRGWFIESVEKDTVVFGYKIRSHYLSVRMEASQNRITRHYGPLRKPRTKG